MPATEGGSSSAAIQPFVSSLGLPTAPAPAAEHRRKLRGQGTDVGGPRKKKPMYDTGKDEEEEEDEPMDVGGYKRLTVLAAQMAVSAYHTSEVAKAFAVDVHLVKEGELVQQAIKAGTTAYAQMVATLDKEAKADQPPPYVMAWDSLVAMGATVAKSKQQYAPQLITIEQHIQDMHRLQILA